MREARLEIVIVIAVEGDWPPCGSWGSAGAHVVADSSGALHGVRSATSPARTTPSG